MRLFEAAKSVSIKEAYERYVGKIGAFKKLRKSIAVKCPFHDDKNPSLHIYPNNTFYCFGCHAGDGGASVVDFVMKLKGVDNVTAAKMLCQDFGVQYEDSPYTAKSRQNPGGGDGAAQDAKWLASLNNKLVIYFEHYLQQAPNPNYFADRGIGALAEEHRFGYCPDKKVFVDQAVAPLVDYGLSDSEGRCTLRGRYIVPILSSDGNAVAFIGRATAEMEARGEPKYIITGNTPLFAKRKAFFNPNGLRGDEADVIVTEGVFDALSLIASGRKNVVAALGNSLSDQQVEMIAKTSKSLVCAFDADEAGRDATRKLMGYAKGLKVKVPAGDMQGCKDANELLLKAGAEGVAAAYGATEEAPIALINEMKGAGAFRSPEGQDAAWKALAKVIGADDPAYAGKYPPNTGYTPIARKRYWEIFSEAAKEGHRG